MSPVSKPVSLYPVFMKLSRKKCLIVGGGEVAARKALSLVNADAEIVLIAPRIVEQIGELIQSRKIRWLEKEFSPQDLWEMKSTPQLVIAATDNPIVQGEVSACCRHLGIPLNVVDQPELCTFFLPAVINRAPVQIAISTQGVSPLLARLLRARLECLLPQSLGEFATWIGEFRGVVKQKFKNQIDRSRFWVSILNGAVPEMVFSGKKESARVYLLDKLAQADAEPSEKKGEVYLVGAGPGDPELLTLRAVRLMQQADLVVYDRLVSPAVLDFVRRDAQRICVGKSRGCQLFNQDEINDLLIRSAREGKRVVRLKGGDPFIFGRGGEEMESLASAGIPFQVAPGITSAIGCAAYCGIPLTHRAYAHSVLFVSGHQLAEMSAEQWQAWARPQQTLAVYMGLLNLDGLRTGLINHGMMGSMPVALIENGTLRNQKIIIGTVDELPYLAEQGRLTSPVLAIIGRVVELYGIGEKNSERVAEVSYARPPWWIYPEQRREGDQASG